MDGWEDEKIVKYESCSFVALIVKYNRKMVQFLNIGNNSTISMQFHESFPLMSTNNAV